jgi:GNAT superfamily N-acetyltransferase
VLEEQLLDPKKHDRQSFSSGVADLDVFLSRFAMQQSKKGITVVRVLVDTDAPKIILGYYSLSAAQVDTTQLDALEQQKLPRYPVPCFRLGRLATHVDYRGRGFGRLLIGLALSRCLEAQKLVAAYALLVDAKDDDAAAFYKHYGFTPCSDHALSLYLPLGQNQVKN